MWFMKSVSWISFACHIQQLRALVNIVMLLIQKWSSWVSNVEMDFFGKDMKAHRKCFKNVFKMELHSYIWLLWNRRRIDIFDLIKITCKIGLHNFKIEDNPDAVMQNRIVPMKINCSSWTIQITQSCEGRKILMFQRKFYDEYLYTFVPKCWIFQ